MGRVGLNFGPDWGGHERPYGGISLWRNSRCWYVYSSVGRTTGIAKKKKTDLESVPSERSGVMCQNGVCV